MKITRKQAHEALAAVRESKGVATLGYWTIWTEAVVFGRPGSAFRGEKTLYFARTVDGYVFGGYDRIASFAEYLSSGRAPTLRPRASNV